VPPPQYVGLFKEAGATDGGEGAGERIRYEREIRYLDDVLAEFVAKLDAASEPARTLLIVTSAHGEEFLEHGAREHGAHLYEETVRVPLLMRGDGIRGKRRHAGVIGLIDIAPTILDLAGFAVPSSMQGTSIAKELRKGQEPELGPRFSEAHALRRALAETDDTGWKPPAYAISDSTHKLLTYVVEERRVLEAYDLAADPGEKADVLQASPTAPPWVVTLRDALEKYTNQCRSLARQPTKTETLPVSTLFKLKAFRLPVRNSPLAGLSPRSRTHPRA
jgi:arylsulfatase A-like enzyme